MRNPFTNGVGYDKPGLKNGYTVGTPTFMGLVDAEGGIDIQSIIPERTSGGAIASGAISIQEYSNTLGASTRYAWINDPNSFAYYEIEKPCWVDMNEEVGAEKIFEQGEGYIVSSGYEDAVLTYNGQVLAGATICKLLNGYTTCGNSTPADVDIQAIVPLRKDDGVIASGAISIQEYSNTLGASTRYAWINDPNSFAYYEIEKPCWVDMNEEVGAEKVFDPGEGYIASSGYDDSFLKLPSALPVGK